MPRVARPLFRRTDRETGEPLVYIAVKPIMTGSKSTIQPGEEVNLRPHQLRSLYQRRRIGPKGHAWTEQALSTKGFPLPFTSDNKPNSEKTPDAQADQVMIEPVKDQRPWSVPGADERFEKKADAKAFIEAADDLPEGVDPVNDGLIWTVPGCPDRFAKKTDATAWIEANPAEPTEGVE